MDVRCEIRLGVEQSEACADVGTVAADGDDRIRVHRGDHDHIEPLGAVTGVLIDPEGHVSIGCDLQHSGCAVGEKQGHIAALIRISGLPAQHDLCLRHGGTVSGIEDPEGDGFIVVFV